MVVVISDIHITDETSAINVDGSAFDLLAEQIESLARKRKATELELVLLGDILDPVRTTYWHAHGIPQAERPWGGDLDPDTAMNRRADMIEGQFLDILDRVLATRTSHDLATMFARLSGIQGVHGRLPLHVTYVVGNHDRVLNNFPSLQVTVQQGWGVPVTFANLFDAPDYGLLARHGHEHDELCHAWEFSNRVMRPDRSIDRTSNEAYRMMALGEVITAELMSGVIYRIRERLAGDSSEGAELIRRNIVDVNNLRPETDVFRWMEWFTRGEARTYELTIFGALHDALDDLLGSSLAQRWDDLAPTWLLWGDLTDDLDRIRTALRTALTAGWARREVMDVIVRSIDSEESRGEDPLESGARAEWGGPGNGEYQFVVYGHTHEALHRTFSADRDGRVRMYINTGTYLPNIRRTDEGNGFYSRHSLSFVVFYNTNEDTDSRLGPGPTVDCWNGFRIKQYDGPTDSIRLA